MTEQKTIAHALHYRPKEEDWAARGHFIAGVMCANIENADEIAELVALLQRIHATAPAGSGAIAAWYDVRAELRQTLEKYEKQ